MLYFSELQQKPVYNDKVIQVGYLKDLLFRYAEIPVITKLVIETLAQEKQIIALSDLKKIAEHITIAKDHQINHQADDELSIAKNLLDRQVIDLTGDKVVRINDIIITETPNLYISGIDISIWGILRRLGLLRTSLNLLHKFKIPVKMEALSWGEIQSLELEQGKIQMKVREEKIAKIRPEDLADHLQSTNISNIKIFLQKLNLVKAAEVFASLTAAHQTELIRRFKHDQAAQLLQLLDPDEAADILLSLGESRRTSILESLPAEKKEELTLLLHHSSSPMGELMTTEFFDVNSDLTVKEVIGKISKETSDFACLYAVYVLNEKSQLVGVFSLHELLMQLPDTQVFKFMIQNPITINLSTPAEIALHRLLRYNLSALPVINNQKHVLGMVTLDDLRDYIKYKP